ncbi:MAG: Sporulation domain protein [Xanthobacteraceae bacterium]|jgi:hypothetical protein|nr:Sporulation domain protein [Xanthobacteraceae bacterium]
MRTRDEAAYGQRPAGARPSADDPLAELARLIGQEDPFAEFFRENSDAAAQGARNAAPQGAPAARPAGAPPRPAHAEPMRSEPARPEPPRHEPPRHEPPRHEAPRHEAPRHETPRPGPGPFSALAAEVYAEPTPRQNEPLGRTAPSDFADAPRTGSRSPRENDPPRPTERSGRVSDRAAEAVAEALFAPTSQPAPVARTQPATPARDTHVARDAAVSRAAPAAMPGFDASAGTVTARSGGRTETGRTETGRTEPQSRGGYTLDDDAYDYGRTAYERDGYEDEAPGDADDGYEYEAYEEQRPPRSRRLALLGTAIGCAILLIAGGYFGLRAMSGGGTIVATGQPPVIRADQGPNKVAPPQPAGGEQTADGQKLIYDRVGGDPSGNERVVSSQEEPVDPSQAAQPQAAQPRVILPPTGGGNPAPSPSAPAPLGAMPSASPPQPQPSSAPANSTEPKRVRTLTVRADGTVVDGSSAPVIQPPNAPIPLAPSAQAAAPIGAPTQVSSFAPDDASSTMPATVPLPPTRVAAAPASPSIAAPAAAAASDQASAGGYFVQVAAQRTQGEAQSAWRATQGKFPGILGSYSANIRRADLGDRGIYYRAQVGPFNSKDQANELCQSLRAQGGDCMVQRN